MKQRAGEHTIAPVNLQKVGGFTGRRWTQLSAGEPNFATWHPPPGMASPFPPRPPKTIRTAQDASKTPRTRLFFGICFSMPFLIDFWLILHPNLPPKTYQNWSKIDQKSMPRGTPSWTLFFDRFLIDFWSIFRPPEPQKSLKFYWFYKYFCKIGLSKLTSIFDLILGRLGSHAGRHNGRGHCRCAARLSLLAGSLAALSGYFAFLASKIIKNLLVL